MNILCGLGEKFECSSASHGQSWTWPGSYSYFETLCVPQLSCLPFVSFFPLQGFSSMLYLYDMFKYQFLHIQNNLKNEHVETKGWLVHAMRSNGPLHQVLLILIFVELISKTNTLGADLKLIGCLSAQWQSGHSSCILCSKEHNQWEVDFCVSPPPI